MLVATAFAPTPTLTVATVSGRRVSAPPSRGRRSSLPHLPSLRSPFAPSNKLFFSDKDSHRSESTPVRSWEDSSSSLEDEGVLTDLKEKWDAIEDKSSLLIYGTGTIVAVWLSSVLVNAISSVPLLPTLMEVVGLGYTGWFVYRYLLLESSRRELASEIETLKKKIIGSE